MKKILLTSFFLLSMIASGELWAQERTISGKVTSISDGSGLPGVNVVLEGTTNGTITDVDGNYKLTVPSAGGVLKFTFIGLATEEIEIGERSVVDVQMSNDVTQLTEVVVTANQIEREKRTLGYAVTTVGGEELTKAREVNLVNSLSGKVAGVQVGSSGGGLGGDSFVRIRGISSLSGDNQPLFVVDGVPVSNSNLLTGSGITGTFNVGNGAGEINPSDVESMTVLKGASAAALYGSRASNGAIIITTKRGKKSTGPLIELNSSARFEDLLVVPDFQNAYSGGTNGKYNATFLDGWGERIEGQTRTNYQDLDEVLTAQPSNYEDFFNVGRLYLNSISLSNATNNGDYRVGVTQLNQKGIVPSSQLDRTTLALNAGSKLSSVFNSRISVNYVNSENIGQVAAGGNSSLVVLPTVLGLPRTQDINALKVGQGGDSTELKSNDYPRLSDFTDSPYYTVEQTQAEQRVERMYGFVQLGADPTDWLNITARAGLDWRTDQRFRAVPIGTLGVLDGSFTDDFIDSRQLTTSLIASITKELNSDLKLTAIIGHEYNNRNVERLTNTAVALTIPGLYTPSNASTNTVTNDFSVRRFHGVYGDVSLTYKNYLTLNLTGRNDWSSTLPVENNSYFYPSANMSFIFTDAFGINEGPLSYGKFRAGVAQVGSDTDPYQLAFNFLSVTNIRGQYGQGLTYPFLGEPGFAATNTIPPLSLRPEIQQSFEVGTELQFFDGRLGLDFTYYSIETKDQILPIPTSESTGFGFALTNVGVTTNNGIEFLLSGTPVKVGDFQWDAQINFTRNRFKTKELADGVEEVAIAASFSGFGVNATVGEDLGLFGTDWLRDSVTGRPIVDPTTGLRRTGEEVRLGNLNPDFQLGFNNTLTYKGLSLGFLIDWKNGGKIFSNTVRTLRNNGLAEETLDGREGAIVDTEALIDNGDGTFRDNDIAVTPEQFWGNYSSSSTLSSNIFDASYVKLREVILSYALPNSIISKTPFRNISLGIEARNVAILFSRTQHIDPEASLFQSSNLAAGSEERFGVPSTRSLGFNLRLGL